MKKIYLLLLLSCISFVSPATLWYSQGGNVTDPTKWNSAFSGFGTTFFTAEGAFPGLATDTFILQTGMLMPAGTWDVAGTIIVANGIPTAGIQKAGAGASIISLGGALVLNHTGYINTAISGAGPLTVNIYGPLYVLDSGRFVSLNPITPNYIHVRCVDTADIIGPRVIKWTSVDTSKFTSLIITSTSTRSLVSDVRLPWYADESDSLLGTLYASTFKVTSDSTDTFTIASNAYLYTANTGGLDSTLKMMYTRHYSGGAHYIFNNPSTSQLMGYSLPTNFVYPGSVTIDDPFGVTLPPQATTFDTGSSVNLEVGAFVISTNFTANNGASINIDSGRFFSAPNYGALSAYGHGVNITYENLSLGALSYSTNYELQPATNLTNSIGKIIVNKPGATITLGMGTAGLAATANDSVILEAGVLDANSSTSFNITANSHWINNDANGAFVPRAGTVNFSGSVQQTIGGFFSTTFNNVVMNNTSGLAIADTEYINSDLDFLANGKISIGTNELFFGSSAGPVIGAGSAAYIIDNTTGHVHKQFSSNGSYTFPVGDATNYTPITLNITAASYAAGADASVNLKPVKHPANTDVTNYLNRYWQIIMTGMSGLNYTPTATYIPGTFPGTGDVTGTEAAMATGVYNNTLPWVLADPANTTTHTLTMTSSSISADTAYVTGIDTTRPTLTVTADTRICIPGATTVALNVLTHTGNNPITYTWAPATGLAATTGASVSASPTVTTTYTVTITDGNGFTNTATTTVGIDSTPHLLGGIFTNSPLCAGDNLTLDAVSPAYVTTFAWTGPVAISSGAATASATVNSVTTAATGTYTVTLTNGSGAGCTSYSVTPVTVNALPAPTIVTGSGTFCATTTVNATVATGDDIYFQGTTSGGTDMSDLSSSEVITASGIYYFRARNAAGCWGPEGSVTVSINPLPVAYNMTPLGGGDYCAGGAGLDIGIELSEDNTIYILMYNSTQTTDTAFGVGGEPVDFGMFTAAGSYSAIAINTVTTCSVDFASTSSVPAVINIDPLPNPYFLNGDGSYCSGGLGYDIVLAWGDPGINYELFYSPTSRSGPYTTTGLVYAGINAPLDFGDQTGAGYYMVMATNASTGCTAPMADTIQVTINPLPPVFNVTGGGTDCANGPGFPVNVDSSVLGTTYELFNNGITTGLTTIGVTGPISFPNQNITGFYTVVATDTNGCINAMNGSAYIQANPLPGVQLGSLGGAYCVGDAMDTFDVSLITSDPSVTYSLSLFGTTLGSPMAGTGSTVDWGYFSAPGYYKISAVNDTSGCATDTVALVTIIRNDLPLVYTVSGSGSYCAGGAGVHFYLSGSQASTPTDPYMYLIFRDGSSTGSSVAGDGSSPLDLGAQTVGGTYTVIATDLGTGCNSNMLGSASVTVNPLPVVQTVTGGGSYCGSDSTLYDISITSSQTGISYQLYKDGDSTGMPVRSGSGSAVSFGATVTPGTYTVVATDMVTGCTQNMAGSAVVTSNLRPQIFAVTGGGAYCAGTGGVPVGLSNSDPFVHYQLFDTTAVVGGLLAGTGSSLAFGNQVRGGAYTVQAINDTTGCSSYMSGHAIVIVKPLPIMFLMAGGGTYCAGDTGRHVYLDASIAPVHYQLYRGTTAIGSPMTGTGAGLDLGLFTTPGTYTIIATDSSTVCSTMMDSNAVITVLPLPGVYTVSGGGTFCAGAPGDTIFLSGSQTIMKYMLYNGTLIDSIVGSGSPVNFGPRIVSGTYTVIAKNPSTNCMSNMTGSAVITVNPLPHQYTVTGGGNFCAGGLGVHIGLSGSDSANVYYSLRNLVGLSVGGSHPGLDGPAIDFGLVNFPGTFYATATNMLTGCIDTMIGRPTVDTISLPAVHLVTGGGPYCSGDTGVHVGLNASDTGVTYALHIGSTVDTSLAGTGSPLDFGLFTAAGTYSVSATDSITGCSSNMSGTPAVSIQPYLTPTVTLTAQPGTTIFVGDLDTVVAHVTGAGVGTPTYQWMLNGNIVPGATNDTFIFSIYYDNDSIYCNVTSTGMCGGITTTKLIVVNLRVNEVKQILTNNSDVKLMPNPNKGVFNLKGTLGTTDDQEVTVEVTNTLGQTVYRKDVIARGGMVNERIELSGNLANGMYLLNMRSGTINSVIHFVVEQ